jgi:glutamine synthetase
MSLSRFQALDAMANRSTFELEYVDVPDGRISEFFGCNVFNDKAMREYMTEEAYSNVQVALQSGAKLSREDADIVAEAMKRWALDHGATHYTHWFQPLTGPYR